MLLYDTCVIAEGMYSAFISFAQKMSTSVSSVLVGVVLTHYGRFFNVKREDEKAGTNV